jgi:hypothetical protein
LSGWVVAARRALLILVTAGAAAEAIVLLLALAAPKPGPGAAEIAGGGAALLYLFHHVPLVFDVPRSLFLSLAEPSLKPLVEVPVSLAPLTATALILWGLSRGGRAVANAVGGGSLLRGLHGMKVALPYAAIAFGLSFAVHARFVLRGADGPTVHPEPLAALLWPLALAAVAGFAGGFRSAPPGAESLWDVRARAVVGGAWRMTWLGLTLSFVGLLVVAVSKPDETKSFVLGAFSSGALQGSLHLGLTFLVVPNMAAWILIPAMGGCTGVSGAFSACLLSYSRFAGPGTLLEGLPYPSQPVVGSPPPPAYFLFLLAPLIAVLAGGALAARRGPARGPAESAALGAGAGAVFAVLAGFVIVLSELAVGARGAVPGFFAAGTLRAGPGLVSGILVAAGWGIVGGGLGGWVRWAMSARVARKATASPEAGAGDGDP